VSLTPGAYAFLPLLAVLAGMTALLVFTLLRVASVTREARRRSRESGGETALLSAALQEAVAKLKAQERAMAARADASERLSGEIISSLTAGVLVVGLGGEIRTLNPAGRRILGMPDGTPQEAFRRSPREAPLFGVIDECLQGKATAVRREVGLPEVGRGVYLGVTVSPLFDGEGRLHGAICLFSDLTGVKDLEEQLRLKDSLAAVGELTAGIAHEFRNGLATIAGYGKLLDPAALPERYRPYVDGIRTEAEALGEVVTNFLAFARPAEFVPVRVDLRTICERAAEEIRAEIGASGGIVDVTGEFASVLGDEVLLRQAFSNLLRNAVEACAGRPAPPRIGVRSAVDQAQRMSCISVDDNGPGIPASSHELIFRPFFTTKRSGTGLGLALVQKIVVFHNGRIGVGTSPLGGASLQVTLPAAG
jgi:PAS domain S-box-containing protein